MHQYYMWTNRHNLPITRSFYTIFANIIKGMQRTENLWVSFFTYIHVAWIFICLTLLFLVHGACSNEWEIIWWWNGYNMRNQLQPVLRYHPTTCLEVQRRTLKHLSQEIWVDLDTSWICVFCCWSNPLGLIGSGTRISLGKLRMKVFSPLSSPFVSGFCHTCISSESPM